MTAFGLLELPGLRGDHPLGFLAACGLLHSLKDSNALGPVKLAWVRSQESSAFVARLHAKKRPDIACLAKIINQRCEAVRESPAYKWSTKIDDREKYRSKACTVLTEANGSPQHTDVLAAFAALASDLMMTDKRRLQSTLFDLTSGNQHFLKSIRSLAGWRGDKKTPEQITEEAISEALLGPWKYQDDYHSLGWDPQTQRLHALRNKTPTNEDTNAGVRAAIVLATQALRLFPCFASNGKLRTTAFRREDGEQWFSWPIWRHPISMDTLCSLVAHPFNVDLRNRGVEIVYQCRRTHTGGSESNYRVFSQPEERPWPLRRRHQRNEVR